MKMTTSVRSRVAPVVMAPALKSAGGIQEGSSIIEGLGFGDASGPEFRSVDRLGNILFTQQRLRIDKYIGARLQAGRIRSASSSIKGQCGLFGEIRIFVRGTAYLEELCKVKKATV